MLQTSNLAVLLIFFLLFPSLVFTKSQVLHLRVGRSHDPLLQKAYFQGEQEVTIEFWCDIIIMQTFPFKPRNAKYTAAVRTCAKCQIVSINESEDRAV